MSDAARLIHVVAGETAQMPVGRKASLYVTVGEAKNGTGGKGKKILCEEITVGIPVGEEGEHLFSPAVTPELTVETEGWVSINRIGKGGYVTYTLQPAGGIPCPVEKPVVCVLAGVVNPVLGLAAVQVVDTSGPEGEEAEMEKTIHYLQKGRPQPYMRNFITFREGEDRTPFLYFRKNQKIRFTWESDGGYYRIYDGRYGKQIYEGKETSFTYEAGIAEDTTFVLEGMFVDEAAGSEEKLGRSERILYETIALNADKQEYYAEEIYVNNLVVYDKADLP